MTIQEALQHAMASLPGDSPKLDAEVLLGFVLGQSRTYLYTWPERELSATQQSLLEELVARRASGTPVAYLVGEREFWSLPLQVNEHTLIPRPETELLVEQALARLPRSGRALDLGTGTGAIALALVSERPDAEIWAVDASREALKVARANVERLGLPVQLVHSDWFAQLSGQRFHLIVSNPPYIAEADPHLGQGDVRFEPLTALASGRDGLTDIRQIVARAPAHLHPGGWLLFEHGYDQGAPVRELLTQAGFSGVETVQDYGGNDRVTLGQWEHHD